MVKETCQAVPRAAGSAHGVGRFPSPEWGRRLAGIRLAVTADTVLMVRPIPAKPRPAPEQCRPPAGRPAAAWKGERGGTDHP